ncbi:hypothetical protein D6774_02730 [Candidatus Woesearchaeota archaeon]|nr:MAG: hypothetical protein D6774_02730 [Candidatus Woesearchaeota archaeon]
MNTPNLEQTINTTSIPRFQAADTTYAPHAEEQQPYALYYPALLEESPLYGLLQQDSALYEFIEQTKPYEIALDVHNNGSYSLRLCYLEPVLEAMMPYLSKEHNNSNYMKRDLQSYSPK